MSKRLAAGPGAAPSAAGLGYALMWIMGGCARGAVFFLVAARSLDRDLGPR